ncbi:sporulation protein YpjB [Salipaludibacillus sp. HK11]|uniref:sporulation protein YpjB n=1 Tax=Salipaludibacillus sp. HK11 TaxID=3394320 RepID=UPI0039FD751A
MRKGRFTALLLLTIMFILMMIAGSLSTSAEEQDYWSDLNHKSEAILRYVKEQHYEEAAELLDNFAETFLQINRADHDLTMTELQVITEAYDEAVYAVKSTSLSQRDRILHVYRLRLLTDVYVARQEPLWHQLKEPLLDALNELNTVKQGTTEVSEKKVNNFISYYETVKPVWNVTLPPERVQKIDSQIQYIHEMTNRSVTQQEWVQHIERVEAELIAIFSGEDVDEESDPSFYWLIITISSAIFSSLSYVGWRKYNAHKAARLNKKKRQNE